MSKVAVVLPARYGSTRFPGKPLHEIAGKPLIEWVYRRAQQIRGVAHLVVATDDQRIADVVSGFAGNVALTHGDFETGTDRVAAVAEELECDIVVNLQGDEPVFNPADVEALIARAQNDDVLDIVTASHAILELDEINSPHVVKLVTNSAGEALYFSRSVIPHPRGGNAGAQRHVGIYVFRRDSLLRFAKLPRPDVEISEQLEQLRALYHGMKIGVVEISQKTYGVDTPEDAKNVARILQSDIN